MTWIDDEIPEARGQYEITSKVTDEYNCIAWAAGDNTRWWEHTPGYYWPAVRSPLIGSLVAVFESIGYSTCESSAIEEGYEKVALYAKQDCWMHAARLLDSGRWTSKLGPDEDIEHESAECLARFYGQVYCYMRRLKSDD